MKYILSFIVCLFLTGPVAAKNYFIAVDGNDSNTGTIDSPFATLRKAQSLVEPGDTVYFRGGTYKITEDLIMNYRLNDLYACVFDMAKSGKENQPICYWGYQNERPVFDLSEVKPADKRISAFYVTADWLHFRNFEIIGTQVTIIGHTQSECISNRGGSNNIYEYLSMHDGMAIGFYLMEGANNLILNCDAYNNYDMVSEGVKGGNVDGFGGHPSSASYTGNVFRGCRAWYNSDDGFDLIKAFAACTIENCWSFYNGYRPNSFDSAGDGSGFKSGGYGMGTPPKAPEDPNLIPQHTIQNCLAYYNKNKGFYSNHHLGGINWYNNTGYKNPSNFCMLNRKSFDEAVDVDGYAHIIKNNLSFEPRQPGKHIIDVNEALCEISDNSFLPVNIDVTADDFFSLDATELMLPRKPDGSLPVINFLRLKPGSLLHNMELGNFFTAGNSCRDSSYDWLLEATIVIENTTARVVGPKASKFTKFYINRQEVNYTNGVNLSSYAGALELVAATADGEVTKLKIIR